MSKALRLLPVVALLAGALVWSGTASPAEGKSAAAPSISPTALAALEGDFIALNTRGTAKNISGDSMRTVFELELFSLATGEKIGTARDDVFCSTSTPPPCQVFDAVTTFRLPGGQIVNHAQVSVIPDPQRPGWFMVSSRPSEPTIENATGKWAGRTGRVDLTGVNEGSRYPGQLTTDDLWVIHLDPK
jgi:hypothetical protein